MPVTEILLERAAKGTDALAYPSLHLVLSDALDLDLFEVGEATAPNAEFDSASVAMWRSASPSEMRASIESPQELAKRVPEIAALGRAPQARSVPPYLAVALLGGVTLDYVHSYFGVSAQRLAAEMDEVKSNGPWSMPRMPKSRAPKISWEARRASKIADARKELLSLIASREASSRTKLERFNKSLVSFLRRWDQEWFDRTLPTKGRGRESRISDLAEFDTALAATLVGLQREALQKGKARRLTVSLACSAAGFRLDYYFATGGLPKCHELIVGGFSKTASTHTPGPVKQCDEALHLASLDAGH